MQIRILSLLAGLLASGILFSQDDFSRTDTILVIEDGNQLVYPWAGGINAGQFSTIDLNFDNTPDLFVFDREGNRVLTFINQGLSNQLSYVYAPEYESGFPSDLKDWCLLRDYNCDGKKDIFSYTPGGIRIFKNTSNVTDGIQFEQITEPYLYSYQPPNNLNLFVSSVDIPAIADIDGDSDLDILTFGVFGTTIEYHRNLSMETYGVCDSLKYELRNLCWGGFAESTSSNSVILNHQGYPCTTGNVSNPEMELYEDNLHYQDRGQSPDTRPLPIGGGYRHTGSTILSLDMDGNGVMELVLGDVSFKNLVMLTNGGTAPNMNSLMIAQDTLFPSNTTSVDLQLFPAAFYEDLNNDNIRDLIVCPNTANLSEDTASVWFYTNSGANDNPTFNFNDKDEFQENMIEVGTGATPVLFDQNADGLTDLLVSNMGYYDNSCNCYKARIALYRNTGTASHPEYSLITRDFEGLSSVGLANSMHPTFGDVDNDGDDDMFIGDGDGVIHYFENIAGSGNPADFVLSQPNYKDAQNNVIDVGLYATPVLADLDRDSDLDLVLGERNGNLNYYENIGTSSAPSYEFITDSLGDVDAREYFELQGGTGFSIPWIIDRNGEYELYLGTKGGWVHKYDSIDNNLTGTFNAVDTAMLGYNGGRQTAVTVGDLTNDGLPEMIIGNYSGGVHYFSNGSNSNTIEEYIPSLSFNIYPNPADQEIFVNLPGNVSPRDLSVTILDVRGRVIEQKNFHNDQIHLSTEGMSEGIYLLKIDGVTFHGVERFIIKH